MGRLISILRLWPTGSAWSREPGSFLYLLSEGLARETERVQARALSLLSETDPRTARELETDWQRVTDTTSGREAAGRLAAVGGASRASIIEIARALGFEVEIREYFPLRAGARVGARVIDQGFASSFDVEILSGEGDLTLLTTILERIRQAHTSVRVVNKRA